MEATKLDHGGVAYISRLFGCKVDTIKPGIEAVQQLPNPTSHWNAVLKNLNPVQTTVPVWVYPDSFDDHALVLKWLYENKFKMASWPLEFGSLISGGPDGLNVGSVATSFAG